MSANGLICQPSLINTLAFQLCLTVFTKEKRIHFKNVFINIFSIYESFSPSSCEEENKQRHFQTTTLCLRACSILPYPYFSAFWEEVYFRISSLELVFQLLRVPLCFYITVVLVLFYSESIHINLKFLLIPHISHFLLFSNIPLLHSYIITLGQSMCTHFISSTVL